MKNTDREEVTASPMAPEELVKLLEKELDRRTGGENFKETLTIELKELITGHLRKKNVFNGAEESEHVLKKVDYYAKSIVESIQWANLSRKMTELAKKTQKGA